MTSGEREKLNKTYNLLLGIANELGLSEIRALALGERLGRTIKKVENGALPAAAHKHKFTGETDAG